MPTTSRSLISVGVGAAFNDAFIFINSESSFPVQTMTEITVEAGKTHVMTSPVSTAKNFVGEDGAIITAFNQESPNILTYTGAGTMFDTLDSSFTLREMGIDCPSGKAFNTDETAGGAKSLFLDNITIVSCDEVGTFNKAGLIAVSRCSITSTKGCTFSGATGILTIDKSRIASSSATFKAVDLGTSVFQTLEIDNLNVDGPVGSIAISGLANNGNIAPGRLATIENCEFTNDVTSLSGIVDTDVRFVFKDNNAIPNTVVDAMVSLNGNALETVISAISTPVKINGVWTIENESHFVTDTTGRKTYIGERPIDISLDGSTTTKAASGTNKEIRTYFALNGSVIINSGKKARVGANDPRNTSLLWQLKIQQNDYIEQFQENTSDTVNLVTEDATSRVG